MRRIVEIVFLALFLALIASFIIYKIPVFQNQKAQVSAFKYDSLSLDQKIGQLFIIGFEGKVLNEEIKDLVEKTHPGGVLLLGRNIESKTQLKELINSLQETALKDTGIPLFVAVDQEGGLISRINWVDKTPQSEIETPQQAYLVAKKRAEGLKELGINLNLAPLLDWSSEGDFIFERSFQKETGELARQMVLGQKLAGIFTAVKHFPGYGNISFNPEERLARMEKIPETSQFKNVDPEMIMVSNVVYEELDDQLPFSFSDKGIQFLRDEIKGDYLIISDDLAQNSLLNEFSLKEIVSLPVISGVDILIFSGWRIPAEQGIEAFKKADVPEELIDDRVLKIIDLKKQLNEF